MGLYNFCLGKGIIIPLTRLVREHTPLLLELTSDPDILFEGIRTQIGKQYELTTLGHDAFDSRHGHMDVFDGMKNMDAYNLIKKWQKEEENQELVFVGLYKELTGGEMSYRVETPELLYSLPAFLPEIVEYYPVLQSTDLSSLEVTFGQPVCIWTFGTDCACCT